jgi:hypothetical protein
VQQGAVGDRIGYWSNIVNKAIVVKKRNQEKVHRQNAVEHE